MKPARSILLIFLIVLTSWVTSCQQEKSSKRLPEVIEGRIDLSDWDFSREGIVELSGDWEFFWNRFLYSEAGSELLNPEKTGYVEVPGDWTRFRTTHREISRTGFASYRLLVDLGEKNQALAMKINMVRTSHQVYLNGKPAGLVGKPGITKESTTPMDYPIVIDLPEDQQVIEVVIQVSNFHHQTAGIRGTVQLGTKSEIRSKREKHLLLDVFIAGCLLVMAVYHLLLFSLRKQDQTPLYFGILCLLQCYFTLERGERYLFYLLEKVGWELIVRGGFIIHTLTIFFFLQFLHGLFNQRFSPLMFGMYRLITGVFLLFGFVIPLTYHSIFGGLLDVFTAVVGIHIIYFLFRLYIIDIAGSGIFLLGVLVIFLTLINDILVSNWVIHSPLLFPYGFLFFVFCQAYLLSVRFNNAFIAVENLTEELKTKSNQLELSNRELFDLNQNLELRVEDRTRELSITNQELHKEVEERRTVEKKLRESEHSFRSLADQSFMGIAIVKGERILYANKATAEIAEYSVDEFVRESRNHLRYYVHPDDLAEVLQMSETLEVGGKVSQMAVRIKSGGGTIKWVETYFKKVLHEGNSATLITLIDVTERRENEARLESLRHELVNSAHRAGMADIAANTLHNVGNILNSVKTSVFSMQRVINRNSYEDLVTANNFFLDRLEENKLSSEQQVEFKRLSEYYQLLEDNIRLQFSDVKDELSRISGMVDSISRVIHMQQAYATGDAFEEQISPSVLVEEAIRIQKDALSMHQVKIVRKLQKVPEIPLQKTKLLYILTNLILNAIQAMEETPDGQRVLEIQTEDRDKMVMISIKDSGCGIQKEDLEKVFNFGFSTKKNSHGYGLHSCANYMNEMKGEIKVLSEGERKGAIFILLFPQ